MSKQAWPGRPVPALSLILLPLRAARPQLPEVNPPVGNFHCGVAAGFPARSSGLVDRGSLMIKNRCAAYGGNSCIRIGEPLLAATVLLGAVPAAWGQTAPPGTTLPGGSSSG